MEHAQELKTYKSIAYPETLSNYFIPRNNEVPITTYDLLQQRTSDEKPYFIKREKKSQLIKGSKHYIGV